MNRSRSLALAAVGLLAMAGCAVAPSGASVAEADAAEVERFAGMPCQADTSVARCSDILTDVVLSAGDTFDELSDPTQAEVEADIALGRGAEWAEECRLLPVETVGELPDECVDIMRDIAEGALVIDPALDD